MIDTIVLSALAFTSFVVSVDSITAGAIGAQTTHWEITIPVLLTFLFCGLALWSSYLL